MLHDWIKGNFNATERDNLYPCWRSIVYAVADGSGAQNPAEASKLAKNWIS